MKKFLKIILVALLLLIAVLTFNTLTFTSNQPEADPVELVRVSPRVAENLAAAIAIPTISNENGVGMDSSAFYRFREFLGNTYPTSDSIMDVTYINEFSIIMHWRGTNPDLKPAILMGHIDVVPVPEENLSQWSHPPFDGVISDGIIWGRGAIDNKINVVGLMEAAEYLINQGHQPARDIYFCFGHDEEVGGLQGAGFIVQHLQNKGIEAAFILDEGGIIGRGLVPGVDKTVAMIGTGEKGYATLNLKVEMKGGHSSSPSEESAIDVMSRAVLKLKDNPFPAEVSQPLDDFMNTMGPEMSLTNKVPLANRWLFEPIVLQLFGASPQGNAMIRTTTAPTIIQAGVKDNIIPYSARATMNFRLLPGITLSEVEEHVRTTINDSRIKIEQGPFNVPAPPASSTDSEGYKLIATTIKEAFPEYLVTPTLLSGATDSRHYLPLSKEIYRFSPILLDTTNQNTVHGIDERISVEDYQKAVQYYILLLENTSTGE